MFEQKQEIYKVSPSTKKMQVWSAWTEGNTLISQWGELGGTMQQKAVVAEAKNIGRSNETTADQQAEVELQALYAKQIKNKHYELSTDTAITKSECCRIPRKITNYKDRHEKMPKVLLSSVKKNGSRGCVVDGTLYSKAGLPEDVKVDHLRAVLEELADLGDFTTFDAEVYAEGLSLQRIRSSFLKPVKTDKEIIKIAKDLAKKRGEVFNSEQLSDAVDYIGYNPNDDAPQLKFFVFDIPDDTGIPYKDRVTMMHNFEEFLKEKHLEVYFEFLYPVETHSFEERLSLRNKIVADGSEGLVHYDPEGIYEYGKRSTNTAKDKPRYDTEMLVLSVTKDKNGEGLLQCRGTKEFDYAECGCKMKVNRRDGTTVPRDYESMLDLVGKWITMSYEEISDHGVFTKPVGELVRECDSQGNPLE